MSSSLLQELGLTRAATRALEKKARRQGKTPPEYVRTLIERDLLLDESFDEILKPVRDGVRHSGLTEEQLDGIVDRARSSRPAKGRRARQ